MKWSEYFIPTLKETPNDAVLSSHILMLRSGMVRKTGSGLYSYLPYGLKILKNIEKVVREEIDAIGGLEVTMPLLINKSILKQSGRWEVFEKELFRLIDRNDAELALSPTNEENFTELVKNEVSSYRHFPISFYQINNKFRDEIRPRYGVMRGKEFIMKDAYSFHLSEECLNETYGKFKQAYIKIFERLGLDFVPVKADSGSMGGSASSEFMVKSEVGEETIVFCDSCGYVANIETANQKVVPMKGESGEQELVEVSTPDQKTIVEVCDFLEVPIESSIKTLIYEVNEGSEETPMWKPWAVALRGDFEVNEVKLKNVWQGRDFRMARGSLIQKYFTCGVGYLGVRDLHKGVNLVVDESLKSVVNGVMGANRYKYHLTGVSVKRDIFADREEKYENIYLVQTNLSNKSRCTNCDGEMDSFKGIEVGHIFKLGSKYCDAFSIKIVNSEGRKIVPKMGCYGIGINRVMAAVIEQSHDTDGVVLPKVLAPFQVVIVSLNPEKEVVYETSRRLYDSLIEAGITTLWDDRKERAGVKFSDADLIGVPCQIVVGERGIKSDGFEVKLRMMKATENADKKSSSKKTMGEAEIIPFLQSL